MKQLEIEPNISPASNFVRIGRWIRPLELRELHFELVHGLLDSCGALGDPPRFMDPPRSGVRIKPKFAAPDPPPGAGCCRDLLEKPSLWHVVDRDAQNLVL